MQRRRDRIRSKLVGVLLAAHLLIPAVAGAKPPKKPKPSKQPPSQQQPAPAQSEAPPAPPTSPTPPPGLDAVEERLWHYQTDAAREAVGKYADQADTNPYVAVAFGRVREQEKSYGEAEARLKKAAELAPGDPAPFVYLGEVYLRQSRDSEANGAFSKAAQAAQAKGGPEAAYYLGIAQQRLKQYDAAIATLQGARAPQPALLPYQIGVTRAFQGNWQAAAEQLSRAIDMDSGLAYAYYYRGRAQEKLGRKDLLVNDLERFVTLAPNAPEADLARAIVQAAKR
jgi:tetratricopeptide (TPR) repeat protein